MTAYETGAVMDVLIAAYPQFYSRSDTEDLKKAVALWAEMFKDDDVNIVKLALKALIATDDKGYPPHIGAVKAKIRQLTEEEPMSEQEAWAILSKAIRRSTYYSREEFEKLPPEIQRVVHSPEQLREWAMSDGEGLETVIASNFQRSYREVSKRRQAYAALPSDIRQVAKQLAESKSMPPQIGGWNGKTR